MVIGTAAYLSPEQAQGAPVDQRSDIYSLGCVLYEMLGGRPPFTGDTPLSVAYRHVKEDPQPPSRVNPDVPAALDAITMKALAKNPENRYQSATELRDDLERFLAGERVLATPLLAPTRTQVMSETTAMPPPEDEKKRTWLWVLAILLILALPALAWLLLTGGGDVEVPDLIGQTQREAEQTLEDLGLEAEVERQASDDPKGEVFDQDPNPGDSVEEGGAVTLFVSSGPAKVEVPDLSGLTKKEAEDELAEVDLELGDVEKAFDEEVPEGEIIGQDPAPDEKIEPGSPVDIIVSAGIQPITVPSVVETSEEGAIAEIEAAGLVPEVITEPNDDFDEGIVFDQDPDAGAEVEPGSTVTILRV